MTLAIFRAVMEEVGTMEPTVFGPCIIPLKKRISSSNFLPSRSFRRNAMPSSYMQQTAQHLIAGSGTKNKTKRRN
jgi:hypothetical protein